MKNKKVIRLFTAMLAVVLCMTTMNATGNTGTASNTNPNGNSERSNA